MKKTVSKLINRDTLNYRKITDKPRPKEEKKEEGTVESTPEIGEEKMEVDTTDEVKPEKVAVDEEALAQGKANSRAKQVLYYCRFLKFCSPIILQVTLCLWKEEGLGWTKKYILRIKCARTLGKQFANLYAGADKRIFSIFSESSNLNENVRKVVCCLI